MNKPRIKYDRGLGLYKCVPNYFIYPTVGDRVGIGSTPEEAYNDYVRSRDKGFGITIIPPETMAYKPAVTFKVVGCEDKPRISKAVGSGLWFCFNIITDERQISIVGMGSTPEEAYWDYVESKALTGCVTEWHKYQPRPEPLVNITYIDPEDMLPEWESYYTYTSGQSVRYEGKVYKLGYVEGINISSINEPPDINYQWVCQSDSGNTYEIRKTSLVEDKPKRWWEIWK